MSWTPTGTVTEIDRPASVVLLDGLRREPDQCSAPLGPLLVLRSPPLEVEDPPSLQDLFLEADVRGSEAVDGPSLPDFEPSVELQLGNVPGP